MKRKVADTDLDDNNDEVTATMNALPTTTEEVVNRPFVELPNTTCQVTRFCEEEYLARVNAGGSIVLQETTSVAADNVDSTTYAFMHSRALDRHFQFRQGTRLSQDVLAGSFARIGHTLTIDHDVSYVRPFALDIDCTCRSRWGNEQQQQSSSRQHIGERDIGFLLATTKRLLEQMLPKVIVERSGNLDELQKRSKKKESFRTLSYYIFRRACGYHVYFDFAVSLPLHCHLVRVIGIETAGLPLKIEVPARMPLPYSSKVPREPYEPFLTEPLDYILPEEYYEFFSYDGGAGFIGKTCGNSSNQDKLSSVSSTSSVVSGGGEQAKILAVLRHVNGRCTNVRQCTVTLKSGLPACFSRVTRCEFRDRNFEHVRDAFLRFVQIRATVPEPAATDNTGANLEIGDSESSSQTIVEDDAPIIGAEQYDENAVWSVENAVERRLIRRQRRRRNETVYAQNVRAALTCGKIRIFARYFNRTHFNDETNEGIEQFVGIAMSRNGALYLQPYVVALHKALEIADIRDFRRYVLEPLLLPDSASGLPCGTADVRQFVQMYDVSTRDGYSDDWRTILDYMSYIFITGIEPSMSVDEQIDRAMCTELQVQSSADFVKSLKLVEKSKEQCEIAERVMVKYIDVVTRLRIVLYNATINVWYVRSDRGAYRQQERDIFPRVNHWLGNLKTLINNYVSQMMRSEVSRFYSGDKWTKSEYLFATYVGVFNTVVGLYTAHTGLLRFIKTRRYSLWNPRRGLDSPRTFALQNREIVRLGATVEKTIELVRKRFSELFTHYLFVPAVVQLRNVYDIDEHRIGEFFNLFKHHKNLSSAYFLVELYPIDPRFIIFISMNYRELDNDIDELVTYNSLANHAFGYRAAEADEERWREYYERTLKEARATYTPYDEVDVTDVRNDSPFGRYMRCLLSIRIEADPLRDMHEEWAFILVMIAVCLIKCRSFRALTDAAGVTLLPRLDAASVAFVSERLRVPPVSERGGGNSSGTGNEDDLDYDYSTAAEANEQQRNQQQQQPRPQQRDAPVFAKDEDDDDEEFDDNNDVEEDILANNRLGLLKPDFTLCSYDGTLTRRELAQAYERLDIRTSRQAFVDSFERTIAHVFGRHLSEFQRNLACIVMVLAMPVCFIYENYAELNNIISTIFVSYNQNKNIFVFYGPQNSGKTLLCDLLQELTDPDCGRFTKVQDAIDRSSITTRNNITIINEMKNLNVEHFKAISGNDGESKKKFFNQEYEMQKSQSLIFGATNNCIKFYSSKDMSGRINVDVDRVSIDRLHAIKLCGNQRFESDDNSDSLFLMLVEQRYYRGVLNLKEDILANSLAWMTYYFYKKNRDESYRPILDKENCDVKNYCERVYLYNNELYSFMQKCGIIEIKDLYISKQAFVDLIMNGINDKLSSKIQRYSDFEAAFLQQYDINLSECTEIVKNFQYAAFVMNIYYSMQTIPSEGSEITEEDLERRLMIYSNATEQKNARIYFKQMNRKSRVNQTFRGITFARSVKSYEGNTMPSPTFAASSYYPPADGYAGGAATNGDSNFSTASTSGSGANGVDGFFKKINESIKTMVTNVESPLSPTFVPSPAATTTTMSCSSQHQLQQQDSLASSLNRVTTTTIDAQRKKQKFDSYGANCETSFVMNDV